MVCCLTAPSHYLNQCCLIISDVLLHWCGGISQEMLKISFLHMSLKITDFAHWGQVTHICVSKQIIIGSDNGLLPGRCQAIIWTNPAIFLIGPLGTNLSEILIKVYTFSFKKMHLKMSSGKCRPSCLSLNLLRSQLHLPGTNESSNALAPDPYQTFIYIGAKFV